MALQAITIADRLYPAAVRSVDFIQRYVFPGSCIPSLGAISGAASTTDLTVAEVVDQTSHYVRTLRDWRPAFRASLPQVRALGYDERFIRLWEFYLAYCEGGFAERTIGVAQVLLAKPGWRCARQRRLDGA